MLGYIFEWLLLMMLFGLLYNLFGRTFEKEDVYLFTAIWGVANLCISLKE